LPFDHPAIPGLYIRQTIPVNLNNPVDAKFDAWIDKPDSLDAEPLFGTGTAGWLIWRCCYKKVFMVKNRSELFLYHFVADELDISNLDGWYVFVPTDEEFPSDYIFAMNLDLLIGVEGIISTGYMRKLIGLSFDGWKDNNIIRENDYNHKYINIRTWKIIGGIIC
jgi:hypothetical protein